MQYFVGAVVSCRGIYFPKSYSLLMNSVVPVVETLEGEKKNKIERSFQSTVKANLSDIDINFDIKPDSIKFLSQVNNYTDVEVRDTPQIKYIWKDGSVVPLTDKLAEERLGEIKFVPGVEQPRFWIIFAGILMITFALVVKIREYYQRKRDSKDDA